MNAFFERIPCEGRGSKILRMTKRIGIITRSELVPKRTHKEKIEIFRQRAGKKHCFFTRKSMNLAKHKPKGRSDSLRWNCALQNSGIYCGICPYFGGILQSKRSVLNLCVRFGTSSQDYQFFISVQFALLEVQLLLLCQRPLCSSGRLYPRVSPQLLQQWIALIQSPRYDG